MPLDTVLVKVASRCNINCVYCYVYNLGDSGWSEMPKQISLETATSIASCLREYIAETQRPLAIVFHGGEPLLLGPQKFRSILEIFRQSLPETCSFGVQTNGILISPRVLDICA